MLINNAGLGVVGAVEETPIEVATSVLDANVVGAIRMIRAVLPSMRERGRGRIVTTSSVLGLLPAPFSALYSASKHALEGYSESLDHEIRQFGVRAVLVQPAFVRTSFESSAFRVNTRLPAYASARTRVEAYLKASNDEAAGPETTARVMLRAATARRPRLRYPVGSTAAQLAALRRAIPERVLDRLLRQQFGLV